MNIGTAKEFFTTMEQTIYATAYSNVVEDFLHRAMTIGGYSTKNVARILSQFPQATYVAGQATFQERGIEVYDGATPITVYAPQSQKGCKTKDFSYVHVFDVSQTTARYERSTKLNADELLGKAVALANKAGVKVVVADLQTGSKVLEGNTLFIKKGFPNAIIAQLLFQELAHWTILKEQSATNPTTAFAISVAASYAITEAYGVQVPLLAQKYKLDLCAGGLVNNIDLALKLAKRIRSGIRRS